MSRLDDIKKFHDSIYHAAGSDQKCHTCYLLEALTAATERAERAEVEAGIWRDKYEKVFNDDKVAEYINRFYPHLSVIPNTIERVAHLIGTLRATEADLATSQSLAARRGEGMERLKKICDERDVEIARLKEDYGRACEFVAKMHAAAVGEICGPRRGVVEDIEDLRADLAAARKVIEGVREAVETNFEHSSTLRGVIRNLLPKEAQ